VAIDFFILQKNFSLSIFLSQHVTNSIYFFNFLSEGISSSITSKSEIVLDLNFFNLLTVMSIFLNKNDFRFNKVSDLVVYDRPSFVLRYVVIYVLSNADRDLKIRIRFSVNSTNTIIISVSELIKSSS
jgi:NADH:ubiquinone oxidoreductase subunit C